MMKTYLFDVELERDDDGRWSAVIQALPGCATWGYTPQEALESLRDAAQAYIEVLLEDGRPLPEGAVEAASIIPGAAVTVTV